MNFHIKENIFMLVYIFNVLMDVENVILTFRGMSPYIKNDFLTKILSVLQTKDNFT